MDHYEKGKLIWVKIFFLTNKHRKKVMGKI